ncbi:MAG TPA: retroviral-like aspartic protease family protein [Planctomycetota bacterium]|nr:retroviral-like aspartic protease family protein [Planctomycetota bacterium]
MTSRRLRTATRSGCLALLSAGGAGGSCRNAGSPPPWIAPLGYRPEEVFPLAVGTYGVPRVPILVEGETVEMVFDTGNATGLSISPAQARRLRLPRGGEWTSLDADGRVLGRFPVFRVREVAALGRVWRDLPAHGLEDDDLDGLLGPRFLLGRRFTLDYGGGRMAVSESPLPSSLLAGALPLIPAKRCEGMPVVEGNANGRPALIQVDTGKSRTCVDPAFAAALGLPANDRGYRIDEVRLGAFSFSVRDAKPVGFAGISEGLPSPIVVGIGSDILSQVLVTVDNLSGRLLLSR